jgi:ligand-binding sensor domain-containing protein
MIDADLDFVYALLIADELVLAGRRSGLYRLSGSGWQPAYDSLQLNGDLATTALAAAGSLIFAGTLGGVLRSDDMGAHWQAFQLPQPVSMVGSLLSGFDQDQIVLAGSTDDGLYRSADGGLSWSPSNIGLYDRHVFSLAQAGDSVLAGTETGLYRSHNRGRSWQPVPFAVEPAAILSLCADSQGRIFAGTETQGLYGAAPYGQTWSRLGETAFDGAVNALLADEARLLALVDDRLWLSVDSGATWKPALEDSGMTAIALAGDGSLYAGYDDGRITQHSL